MVLRTLSASLSFRHFDKDCVIGGCSSATCSCGRKKQRGVTRLVIRLSLRTGNPLNKTHDDCHKLLQRTGTKRKLQLASRSLKFANNGHLLRKQAFSTSTTVDSLCAEFGYVTTSSSAPRFRTAIYHVHLHV